MALRTQQTRGRANSPSKRLFGASYIVIAPALVTAVSLAAAVLWGKHRPGAAELAVAGSVGDAASESQDGDITEYLQPVELSSR